MVRKNSSRKKVARKRIKPEIAHVVPMKRVASHARSIIAWSLVLVTLFAVLSLLASYSDSSEKKSLLPKKIAEVATLSLLNNDEEPITLIATGDILPARFVELKMRKANDYMLPFRNTADFLKNADITFGNLETPIFPGKNTPQDSTTFRADSESVKGLIFAGFDVLSLANNHTMNYKVPGLTSTIQALKEKILYTGAGKNTDTAHTPAIMNVKGKNIAFYAYTDPNIGGYLGFATWNSPGIAKMDVEAVKNDVKNALSENAYGADIVVVSMHAGKEYTRQPTQFQKDFAHAACDAGANAVIGHHPHWVQPVEYYGNCVIFYSLGNFVFDQMWSEETQLGLVVKVSFDEDLKPTAELFPVKIEKTVPKILEGEEKMKALKRFGL